MAYYRPDLAILVIFSFVTVTSGGSGIELDKMLSTISIIISGLFIDLACLIALYTASK
jgi:hypothetical protein